ncbi:site-specific integrase [Deinococcus multiflagellatus]|uniref:Site-specific integrase n=1 Tax=Deinococcus multiflagellatus TaxID=1656887 RepID=A0ABW1ZQL4_9DEIO
MTPSDRAASTTAIVLYRQDALAEVRTWGTLTPEARRRACLRALRDRDVAALQDLLIAYLKLKGAKGTRISPQTERSYRSSMKILVQVSERQGLSLVQPGDEFGALFMRALEAEGQRSATVRVRVVAVKHLYRAARWCGLEIPCPWDTARVPYLEDAAIRHPYPEADVRRLLDVPDPACAPWCCWGPTRACARQRCARSNTRTSISCRPSWWCGMAKATRAGSSP